MSEEYTRMGVPVQDAFELAAIDIPRMYAEKRPTTFLDRIKAAGSILLARPGPKPRFSELTYSGQNPPMLAQHLIRNGVYRDDPVSLDTLELMRVNPIVRLGLIARAAPAMTALREARVESEDPALKAFIKATVVDEWLMRLAATAIIPSYIYGVAFHEKVFEYQDRTVEYTDENGDQQTAWDGPALVYKKLKYVHPMSIDRILEQEGTQDFAGFVQTPPPGKPEIVVEAWKSFVYINNLIYGGLWGESELRVVYPHWYYLEFFRALLADYLKMDAIPPLIGYAPPGLSVDEDGNEVDNLSHAGSVLQQAYASLVVMLPDERDERGNRRWGYEELRVGDHGMIYERAIENLQVDILRGLLVPERTITQDRAAVGSYNQAAVHAERLVDMAKMEVDEFLRYVNDYLVPIIAEDHFGVNHAAVHVFTQAMSEDLKEKLFNVLITLLQNDKFSLMSQQVAFAELLDFLRIPYNKNKDGIITPAELLGQDQDEGEKEDNQRDSEDNNK